MKKKLILNATSVPVQTGLYGGVTADYIRNRPKEQVFAIGHGMGLDSFGMLLICREQGIRPQVITFADTGNFEKGKLGEKPQTYQYIPVVRKWLADNGFPDLIIVRRQAKRTTYETLEECCIVNQTLPSLAFGFKGCSDKFKIKVQEGYMKTRDDVLACWAAGYKIIKAIGYDAGPADAKRGFNKKTKEMKVEDERYVYWYPLREMGWTRDIIRAKAVAEGLPGWNADNETPGADLHWVESGGVPVKSACYFCPAAKRHEIDRMAKINPELVAGGIRIEVNARDGKHGLNRGGGKKGTKGLGRSWSWEEYAGEKRFSLPVLSEQPTLALCEACDG